MSTRFPLVMHCGFDVHGYVYEGHRIWWVGDEAAPWMSVTSHDGREITARVSNPAFHVGLAPSRRRNPLMKRAALEFFAPLLEQAP